MIIDKRKRAMLRCGLAALGKDWAESRIFYCAGKHRTEKEMSLACQVLHDTPFLPWPDRQCVIVSEGWPFIDALAIVARHGDTDVVTKFLATATPSLRTTSKCTDHIVHSVLPNGKCLDEAHLAVDIKRYVASTLAAGSDQDRENLTHCLNTSLPTEPIRKYWCVVDNGQYTLAHTAFIVLYSLANMATACGYRIIGKMREGYGCPSMKKRTKGRTVLFFVSHDRCYVKREETEEDTKIAAPRRAHIRRGHYRYLWKQAGLSLPSHRLSVCERLVLARKHNVRRVYVSPCWVGPSTWSDNGWDFQVRTDENDD